MCVCHPSPFLGPPWLPHCFWEVTFQRLSDTEVQVALTLACVSFHNPVGGSSCSLYSDSIGWSPTVLLGDRAGERAQCWAERAEGGPAGGVKLARERL